MISVLGCASAQKNGSGDLQASARDYMPLAIGATWTYAVSYPGQSGEQTVTITGEKDGYFRDDHKGAFRYTHDGLRDEHRYLIRHPLVVGNTWKTVVSPSAIEHSEIKSVGASCESEAGKFDDCVVVESSVRGNAKQTLHVTWTWAKSVGLVKLETEMEDAGKRTTMVKQSLVRFALGGQVSKGTRTSSSADSAPEKWEH
jgi:hypothetical protein